MCHEENRGPAVSRSCSDAEECAVTELVTSDAGLAGTRWDWTDGCQGAHRPKVVGSNPTPATIASAEAPNQLVRGLSGSGLPAPNPARLRSLKNLLGHVDFPPSGSTCKEKSVQSVEKRPGRIPNRRPAGTGTQLVGIGPVVRDEPSMPRQDRVCLHEEDGPPVTPEHSRERAQPGCRFVRNADAGPDGARP